MPKIRHGSEGMSLLEVTMSVAIFAVVIGITAQSLASYYVTIDMHEQRIEATQAARSVLAACRDKTKQAESEFPADVIGWIDDQQSDGWADFVRTDDAQLANHALNVEVEDMEGNSANAETNPIVIRVTSTWEDRRGHAMRAVLVSAFTDQ